MDLGLNRLYCQLVINFLFETIIDQFLLQVRYLEFHRHVLILQCLYLVLVMQHFSLRDQPFIACVQIRPFTQLWLQEFDLLTVLKLYFFRPKEAFLQV